MFIFKISLISLFTAFCLTPETWTSESIQASLEETADSPFRKLREDYRNFSFEDFQLMHEQMKDAIGVNSKGGHKYYRGNFPEGDFVYTVISHNPWVHILEDRELEYSISLVEGPVIKGFQTQFKFELILERTRRVCDFKIHYVRKSSVEFLRKLDGLKKFQEKTTRKSLEKFLDSPPLTQEGTIKKTRGEYSSAKRKAEAVMPILSDYYAKLQGMPLPSGSAPTEQPIPSETTTQNKRRAFASSRAATVSHLELEKLTRKKEGSQSQTHRPEKTDVKEEKEEKEIKEKIEE